MKAAIKVLWLLTVFCIVVGFVYGYVTDFHELAGFPALLAVGVMSAFLAVYFQLTLRSAKAMLPEDDLEGEISDSAGDYGHFSPWSWTPLLFAAGAMIFVLGLAIDWWIVGLAFPIAMLGVFGMVFEHSRGEHAH